MMDALWREPLLAFRRLFRSPGFTLVVVLTLALGIGANTAIFSLVNGVLLKPLSYRDADQLAYIWENNAALKLERFNISPPNFQDWKEQSRSFEDMVMVGQRTFTLTSGQEPERIAVERVSAGYFDLLGINPFLGRGFLPGEDAPGKPRIAVLGEGFWGRRFGSDSSILGRGLTLDGEVYTVIGVVRDPLKPKVDLWTPLDFDLAAMPRGIRRVAALGRLRPGISVEQAQQEMSGVAASLAGQFPDDNEGWGVEVVSMHEMIVHDIRPSLFMLSAAVGFVLLIAGVNVANLMLARLAGMEREIAVRLALGAGRLRLARQFLAEGLVLALLGGALGLLLAVWTRGAVLAVVATEIPRASEVRLDFEVLGFALGLSLLLALALGLVPLFHTRRLSLGSALKDRGASAGAGAVAPGFRKALVLAEVALALVPLVAAGLLTRSLLRLQAVEPGFEPRNVLTAQVALPKTRYTESHQKVAFYRQVLERARSIPGVVAAASTSALPLGGQDRLLEYSVEGRLVAPAGQRPSAHLRFVSPGYFRTLKIPFRQGSTFHSSDGPERPRTAVVNESMAEREWPGRSPLGQRLIFGDNPQDESSVFEVIGVVADVKHSALSEDPGAEVYMSVFQEPSDQATVVLRTGPDPAGLASSLRREVLSVDSEMPLYNVKTLEAVVGESLSSDRSRALLIGSLAVLALVLACVGIYAVLNYLVAQRRQEIGIRMALGAQRTSVLWLIMGQVLRLGLAGVALGLLVSASLSRFFAGFLFGVAALDPLVYLLIGVLVLGVALLASYLPARQATRVDPNVALNLLE